MTYEIDLRIENVARGMIDWVGASYPGTTTEKQVKWKEMLTDLISVASMEEGMRVELTALILEARDAHRKEMEVLDGPENE